MEKIPRIIHQTWKNSDVPAEYVPLVKTWKENHPGWEYKLWTDEMNRDFIEKYYPDFLPVYDSYPQTIQRVDAVRYFILYKLGGVFIDLDFESLINIEPLLKDQDCVFGIEPEEHCRRHKQEMIICNAFMATSPENDFFEQICKELQSDPQSNRNKQASQFEVVNSTGPFKLTRIYKGYGNQHKVKLISSDLLYPFTLKEVRELLNNDDISEEMQKKIDRAYAVHYFLGTWW